MRYENVVEIGAGDSYSSEGLAMFRRGEAERVTLYEPNALLCADLRRAAEGLEGVSIREEAVTSHFDDLFYFGYASFLRGNPSFLATSIEPEGVKWWEPLAREVACRKVDRVDYGTIDYLICTCNGSEMDVLSGLVSRPKAIRTKTMVHNQKQGEIFSQICTLMTKRGYTGRRVSVNRFMTMNDIFWSRL